MYTAIGMYLTKSYIDYVKKSYLFVGKNFDVSKYLSDTKHATFDFLA